VLNSTDQSSASDIVLFFAFKINFIHSIQLKHKFWLVVQLWTNFGDLMNQNDQRKRYRLSITRILTKIITEKSSNCSCSILLLTKAYFHHCRQCFHWQSAIQCRQWLLTSILWRKWLECWSSCHHERWSTQRIWICRLWKWRWLQQGTRNEWNGV